MTEGKFKEQEYRRNKTLKQLKQMLCKLENVGYEKEHDIPPTVFVRMERCICAPDKPPEGKRHERANLDGGEAFPLIRKDDPISRWTPVYQCMNQDITPNMGCYNATKSCKDSCMCCECEVAEGSHLHLPKKRDCKKPMQSQCFANDVCSSKDSGGGCESPLFPNKWIPNSNALCNFPEACPAECFDHADFRDWVVSKPNYTYYIQSRCFPPF